MDQAANYIDPVIAAQDQMRPVRQFLSLLSGVAGEQSLNGTDAYAINTSGQFATYGPYGIATEGQPIMAYAQNTGLTIAPVLLLAAAAAAAFFLLK